LRYQLAENDNTIKRYLKEIDQTKEFAITKFAKELLDVRDNLELAGKHIEKIKVDDKTSLDDLKSHFEQLTKGLVMTSTVMDKVLNKFGVVQYDPKGEKFDPNKHEAVFVFSDPDIENNHIG
jgi:molecular chaperone GrpE